MIEQIPDSLEFFDTLEPEVTPTGKLLQARSKQALLARMALAAAEERWPGFGEVAAIAVQEENEALRQSEPEA
jgi:hypothetical protein